MTKYWTPRYQNKPCLFRAKGKNDQGQILIGRAWHNVQDLPDLVGEFPKLDQDPLVYRRHVEATYLTLSRDQALMVLIGALMIGIPLESLDLLEAPTAEPCGDHHCRNCKVNCVQKL